YDHIHVAGLEAPPKKNRGGSPSANGQYGAGQMSLEDFYAYLPQHCYLFLPSRQAWPAESVNGRLGKVGTGKDRINASTWLDPNRAVEQMTWMPGEPLIIKDRLIPAGGWIHRPSSRWFNLSLPPQAEA